MDSQLLIIGLHRVGTPPPAAKIRGLFISPRQLEFQLSLIRKLGFRFATLADALNNLPGKTAVLTFDDGYADNFTDALPILEKFDAPATIFVITEDVGKNRVVWQEAGDDLPADIISWEQLGFLRSKGWEIGSHCRSHVHLSRLSTVEQEKLIGDSICAIEKNLNVKPVSFAYPYGDYDRTTVQLLAACGIEQAVTTRPTDRIDLTDRKNLLELPRVSLGGRKFHHGVKNFERLRRAVGSRALARAIFRVSAGNNRQLSGGNTAIVSQSNK